MPISEADLRVMAQSKVEDARVLLAGGRSDGAAYVCGYAVELALKAAICRTLGWPGYPQTSKEFAGYQSFKTHNLDILLSLSGRKDDVLTRTGPEWLIVSSWDPETRYSPVGTKTAAEAQAMIDATDAVLRAL